MNNLSTARSGVLIAGFGSPHGDDQAGWRVVALLDELGALPARVVPVYEMSQLLAELSDVTKLIVVDACRSGGEPGAISRLEWPDRRIVERHSNSTHALGVAHALELAEALGRLPDAVVIYGIEVGDCAPGSDLSGEVCEAVARVAESVAAELVEVVDA